MQAKQISTEHKFIAVMSAFHNRTLELTAALLVFPLGWDFDTFRTIRIACDNYKGKGSQIPQLKWETT